MSKSHNQLLDVETRVENTPVMESIAALETANAEFAARLRSIGPDQWALPTPCSEWNVEALVNHVLLGTRMSVQILDAMPVEAIIAQLNDDLVTGQDPVTSFLDLSDQMIERFAAPGGLEGIVAHPAGEFPRSMFLGFRVADGAAHAWDLATAIAIDSTLDPDLVQWAWDDAAPQRDMLTATGMFGEGASGSRSDDASLQDRYLDLLGRRP